MKFYDELDLNITILIISILACSVNMVYFIPYQYIFYLIIHCWCLKIRWIQVFVGYDVTISITLGGYTDYVLFTYLVDATFVCIIYHEPCYLECIDASLDSIQDMQRTMASR